jgi:hypothetical protein
MKLQRAFVGFVSLFICCEHAPALSKTVAGGLSTPCATWLLPLLLLLTLPGVAHAQFTFTTNNGAITIIGYTGSGGVVIIPGMTNGRPVTGIGNSAFQGKTSVTSVTIPDSVTNLGNGVFSACTGMTNVTIGTGVTSIGYQTFLQCYKLATVLIPDSVTRIGTNAFAYCSSLTSVTIGNSVTNLEDNAFGSCSSLAAVYFQGNAPSIGTSVFFGASFDAAVYYLPGTTGWDSTLGSLPAVLVNPSFNCTTANGTITIKKYTGSGGAVAIPDTINGLPVTSIGLQAFSHCTSLTSVVIPNTVTNIGLLAFSFCTKLAGVYFRGDAPSADTSIFVGDSKAIVYWLPRTQGWEATYAGCTTALWRPRVQTADASFGVQANQFGFNITWASGRVVVVEACTNLPNPIWSALQTNTLSNDSLYFSDPQWTNCPARLYRIYSP